MQIKERPKKKSKSRAYYYWLAEDQPTTKKRLSQLNKANHIRRMQTPKSELILAAERVEHEPIKKGKR